MEGEGEEKQEKSIFDYDIDCVEKRKKEMLKKFPWASRQIDQCLSDPYRIPQLKPERLHQLLEADNMLTEFSRRAANVSFDEQRKLKKVLVEPAAEGEETDVDSDQEGITTKEDSFE